jgi:hypothetical protein
MQNERPSEFGTHDVEQERRRKASLLNTLDYEAPGLLFRLIPWKVLVTLCVLLLARFRVAYSGSFEGIPD